MANELDDFSRRTGAAVQASPLTEGRTLVVLSAVAATNVVCVAYDLSDSADAATARLVGRLSGLLRGWPRETAVWAYALGDDAPLPGVAAGNVGHVLDGAIDLRSPLADTHLVGDRRRRGSFLSPTLDAVGRRAAAGSARIAYTVVVGDGRLTDFAPATPHPASDVLGLVENDAAAVHAAASWRRVIGDAPLLAFDDRRLQAWFTDRRTPATARTAIRVAYEDAAAQVLSNDDAVSPVPADGVSWQADDGPLRLVLPPDAGRLLVTTVPAGATAIGRDAVSLAPPADADDLRRATRVLAHAAGTASVAAATDASATSVDFRRFWQAATEAFTRSATHRPWDAAITAALLPTGVRPRAAVCLANRVPDGAPRAGDRVVVLAVVASALAWAAGERLPVGTAATAFAVRYDPYEDRWHATAGDDNRTELHPAGSQRLADVATTDAGAWAVAFSGSLG